MNEQLTNIEVTTSRGVKRKVIFAYGPTFTNQFLMQLADERSMASVIAEFDSLEYIDVNDILAGQRFRNTEYLHLVSVRVEKKNNSNVYTLTFEQ